MMKRISRKTELFPFSGKNRLDEGIRADMKKISLSEDRHARKSMTAAYIGIFCRKNNLRRSTCIIQGEAFFL